MMKYGGNLGFTTHKGASFLGIFHTKVRSEIFAKRSDVNPTRNGKASKEENVIELNVTFMP